LVGASGRRWDFAFVEQPGLGKHAAKTFASLESGITEYRK
jgi:hypothetical protein